MAEEKELMLRASTNTMPKMKTSSNPSAIPVPFVYNASDDGTDENLLILLHGLGDTHIPFGELGQKLHLPQTATLALRALEQIPYLDEQAFQWYTSFDPLGELIKHPNPTPALELLDKVIAHLITDCAWPVHRIHFFGFAQGGGVAAEFALKFWRTEQQKLLPPPDSMETSVGPRAFGSIVSVSGPLISYPTPQKQCPTPLLILDRPPPSESALPSTALAAFEKGFANVNYVKMQGQGMPQSKKEFEPIMRFWSEHLGRRQMEGLFEVMSGLTPP